ncbi:hypothetical protein ES703_00079 [subsurface metagenome]
MTKRKNWRITRLKKPIELKKGSYRVAGDGSAIFDDNKAEEPSVKELVKAAKECKKAGYGPSAAGEFKQKKLLKRLRSSPVRTRG